MGDVVRGDTRWRKCQECGEWFPIENYHKAGFDSTGEQMWRGTCKTCVLRKRNERGTATGKSPCETCTVLDDCRIALRNGEPLPCDVDPMIMPASTRAWSVSQDMALMEWHRKTFRIETQETL